MLLDSHLITQHSIIDIQLTNIIEEHLHILLHAYSFKLVKPSSLNHMQIVASLCVC